MSNLLDPLMNTESAVVLDTGANRGIDMAFARELLARSARKVYAAAREPANVNQPGVQAPHLDVTKLKDLAAAAQAAADVKQVINNAGIAQLGSILAPDSEGVARRLIETSSFDLLNVSKAFAPVLNANGVGALVNVLPVASWINGGELAAYSASKSTARSHANALHHELAGQKAQVLGQRMAYVDTDLTQGVAAPKGSAEHIVQRALDGLAEGSDEVLADAITQEAPRDLPAPHPTYMPQAR